MIARRGIFVGLAKPSHRQTLTTVVTRALPWPTWHSYLAKTGHSALQDTIVLRARANLCLAETELTGRTNEVCRRMTADPAPWGPHASRQVQWQSFAPKGATAPTAAHNSNAPLELTMSSQVWGFCPTASIVPPDTIVWARESQTTLSIHVPSESTAPREPVDQPPNPSNVPRALISRPTMLARLATAFAAIPRILISSMSTGTHTTARQGPSFPSSAPLATTAGARDKGSRVRLVPTALSTQRRPRPVLRRTFARAMPQPQLLA